MRVSEELQRRAAELGVSVNYWDWHGNQVTVPDKTLSAIVGALEAAPSPTAGLTPPDAAAVVPSARSWGFTVQLYSLRSRESWGHGDLRDLADFAAWSARELGAGFVLINPLHAAEPVPPVSTSPYLPMSRHWVSPLYLRIEDIPEYKELSYPERTRLAELSRPLRDASRKSALIDRDAVWSAKREALELIRKVPLSDTRHASLDKFRARHGQSLADWAAWCALAEVHGPDYRTWPAHLREPHSARTAAERTSAQRSSSTCRARKPTRRSKPPCRLLWTRFCRKPSASTLPTSISSLTPIPSACATAWTGFWNRCRCPRTCVTCTRRLFHGSKSWRA